MYFSNYTPIVIDYIKGGQDKVPWTLNVYRNLYTYSNNVKLILNYNYKTLLCFRKDIVLCSQRLSKNVLREQLML